MGKISHKLHYSSTCSASEFLVQLSLINVLFFVKTCQHCPYSASYLQGCTQMEGREGEEMIELITAPSKEAKISTLCTECTHVYTLSIFVRII